MALLKYILKKMLMLLPVLVGISIVAFAGPSADIP